MTRHVRSEFTRHAEKAKRRQIVGRPYELGVLDVKSCVESRGVEKKGDILGEGVVIYDFRVFFAVVFGQISSRKNKLRGPQTTFGGATNVESRV
jgi:hypothetical protein